MNILQEYLLKLVQYIPKNIGALIGIVQTILEFFREVLILFARMICPIWPGEADEIVVKKIREIVDLLYNLLEKLKNWLLFRGFKI